MMDKSIGYRTHKTSGSLRDNNNSIQLQTNSYRSSNNQFLASAKNTEVNFSSNTVSILSPGSDGYFNEEKSIFNDNSSFEASIDLGNMDDLSFFDNIDAANADKLNFVLAEDSKAQDKNSSQECEPFAAPLAEYQTAEPTKSQPLIRSPVLF